MKFALKSAEHAITTPSVRGMRERYVGMEYSMPRNTRYAATVNSGESPLIVCTSETGIRDVASELRICPPIWNRVSGRVVRIRSFEGGRIPYFRNVSFCFKRGYRRASAARNIHHDETKPNCTRVRVTGFGRAVRIAFEDVFEKIEVMYHIPQSI
jgi:hypothetical protein